MASISNPSINIVENLPAKRVRVDVTCRVNFTEFELFNMQHGVRYRLTCKLLGDDPIFDDSLFNYPNPKIFPDATPSRVENVLFSATMPSSTLNEDDSIFDNTDEVYAALTLRNLETGQQVTANTHDIVHNF